MVKIKNFKKIKCANLTQFKSNQAYLGVKAFQGKFI